VIDVLLKKFTMEQCGRKNNQQQQQHLLQQERYINSIVKAVCIWALVYLFDRAKIQDRPRNPKFFPPNW